MEIFYLIIFLLIAIFIGTIVVGIAKMVFDHKHKNEAEEIFNSLEDFKVTENYLSEYSGMSIAYDKEKKKICILDLNQKPFIYDYADILQSELDINGETILKKSTTGTVGRGVVGGLVAGGAGAIVGGMTGSQKQTEKISSIDLKISVNDSQNPVYRINFYTGNTSKGGVIYNFNYSRAERWHGIIATLIKQAELPDKPSSDLDELEKLAELKKKKLITKAEFEKKKKKILGL